MSDKRLPEAYTFFAAAVIEARAESRRHWGKGGPADKLYPMQPMKWRIPLLDDPAARVEASIGRHRGRP